MIYLSSGWAKMGRPGWRSVPGLHYLAMLPCRCGNAYLPWQLATANFVGASSLLSTGQRSVAQAPVWANHGNIKEKTINFA